MQDSCFTIHKHIIPFAEFNKPIYLFPFGDIHRYAPLCNEEKWLEFCQWASKKDDAYFLGMGDYDDFASFNERRAIRTAGFHESTLSTFDDIYKERSDGLCKEIDFMRNKLIGLIEGNHHGEFQSGITTTQYMCQKLNTKYLGISSFIRLVFKQTGNSNRCAKIDIWAHHGRGASRLVGGSLNSVQQMVNNAIADIYLFGHDHKKSVGMSSVLKLVDSTSNIKLSHKKLLFGRTGSFLKGYEPDCPSYVAKAAMSPTDIGVIKIELTPKRVSETINGKRVEQIYIDVHASI